MEQDGSEDQARKSPAIEWVAGGLGLLITLALIGFVGWQAFQGSGEPPQPEVRITSVVGQGDTYLVKILAENHSSQTVAELSVEGTLTAPQGEPEKSSTTFSYVPGNSEAKGGLLFASDPAAGELQVRVTGYRLP